ncbi:MAG: universal stress protein [Anaerolineaceae bacterium]|jgi:nucleotide-binding universal stress UspA family protein
MFKKILLPLDGSALAERAIPHAIEFARIFNSKILLLRVLEYEPSSEPVVHAEPLNWQLHRTKTEHYLHEVASQIRSSLDLSENGEAPGLEDRVSVTVLEGKVAENIIDFAHREDVDLLVISSHGSSGLSRWNLNSVATKVINLIYKPILIIRGYPVEGDETVEPRYERILLPIDCSRRSECALSAGLAIARHYQSKVFLASVIKPPEISAIDPYDQDLQSLNQQYMELSRKTVKRYMTEISLRFEVENEVRILESPSIFQPIMKLSKDENIDLLIFCAHGHTGELSWPFGTVAHTFIEYSVKPVLVIQDLTRADVQPTAASQITEFTRSQD